MSKAMPLLFVVAGLMLQTVSAIQPVQTPVKTTESEINALFAEKTKWNVLRMQLSEKLDGAQTFTNKIGAVMNNYAALAVALEFPLLIGWKYLKSCRDCADNGASNCSTHGVVGACGIHNYFAHFVLLEFITYGVCKIGGAYLEDKTSQSLRALTEFVQQWELHKTYTPVVLHELFESYAKDLKANGKLTTVDKNGAHKVIESLLAMAVIAETIK